MKRNTKCYILTEEKVGNSGTQIETNPNKVLQQLFPSDWEVRTWYCRRFQESVNSGFIDPKLVFFLG